MKRKRRMDEKHNFSLDNETASQEMVKGAEITQNKTRRKRLESLDENLDISERQALDSSLQTVESVSKIKNKVHDTPSTLQSLVNGRFENTLQTEENHTACEKIKSKTKKKKKKKRPALDNGSPDQNRLENDSLCNQDLAIVRPPKKENVSSLSEIANVNSTRTKENHEVPMDINLISEELSSLSKNADTNLLKKSENSNESNLISLEVKSNKTYRRKKHVKTDQGKEKLSGSSSNTLEPIDEQNPSTSMQSVQNIPMVRDSSNFALTLGKIKKKNGKNKDGLNKAQKEVPELAYPEDQKLEKPKMLSDSSENKLERVKEIGSDSSLQVVRNRSVKDVCIKYPDSESASRKSKMGMKTKKMKESINVEGALKDTPGLKQGSRDERNKLQIAAQEVGCSGKDNLEVSPTCHKKDERSTLKIGNSVKHICTTSPPATKEVCIGLPATSLDERPIMRKRNKKKVKEGEKIINRLEGTLEECKVSPEEKLDISLICSEIEEQIPVSLHNNGTKSVSIGPTKTLPASISIGETSATCSDERPVTRKKIKKSKEKLTVHEETVSNATFHHDHFHMKKSEEIVNRLEGTLEEIQVSPEEKLDISFTCSEMKEQIPVSLHNNVTESISIDPTKTLPSSISIGETSATCSDKRPATGKKIRKRKEKLTAHEETVSNATFHHDHFHKEKREEIVNRLEGTLEELQVSPEEKLDISLTCSEMEEQIPVSLHNKEQIPVSLHNNGTKSISIGPTKTLPASVSIGESSSATCSDERPATRKKIKKIKEKPTVHEGKASNSMSPYERLPKQVKQKNEKLANDLDSPREEKPGVSILSSDKEAGKDVSIELTDNSSLVIENVSIRESSATCVEKRPRMKKVKKTERPKGDEDRIPNATSPCEHSNKLVNQRNEEIINESEGTVEGCHIIGEEKLGVSLTREIEETVTHSLNMDVIKDISIGLTNKENNHSKILPSSPRISLRRKLLVLDVNGLLADIVPFVPDGYKPDRRIAGKALFKRPFCDDFLKFCFERFDVGVWSSRMKKNVDNAVNFLLGDMKHKLLFCWDNSHCTQTGFHTIEDKNKPLVLKELKKLWDKYDRNLPWEKGYYNESNTLLLDDSPYKALRNPPNTAIFPKSFGFKNLNDNSLGPGGDLRLYLEGLAMAENIPKYVDQHQFGQRAISSANSSWGFYSKIIRNHS